MTGFQDGSFDIVHANQLLLHLQDPVQALREMKRLVKKGGIVASRDNITIEYYPHFPPLSGQVDTYRRLARNKGVDSAGGLVNHVWAHEAGYEYNQIERGAGCFSYATPEERQIWSATGKTNALALASAAGQPQDEVNRVVEAFEEWERKDEAWLNTVGGQIICRN